MEALEDQAQQIARGIFRHRHSNICPRSGSVPGKRVSLATKCTCWVYAQALDSLKPQPAT